MTERSSSYNPYASSSSRRASLAWSQPQANSGPQRGPDLKGVPVRPGSPREAKHASAASSSSAAAAQRIPDATPLHERQAQALTGLGGGKRKAQEQLTPQEDSKKARAAGEGLASASFPTLDLLEKCHKELNGAKGAESMYAIHYAAEKVAQWLRGTDRGAAARERILSFSRACPLDSVDDCDAVLQVVNCSGSQDLMEAAGREVGLRLGGTAIDAVARGRLFEACLRGRTYGSWLGVRYFMAGVVSACLPDGFTKERADEWLGHFREATNRPNRVDGFDPGLTWFEIEEGKEALADMAAACDLTSHEIVAYLIREHGHLLMDAENHDFFRCVAYPVYRAFDVSYQAF